MAHDPLPSPSYTCLHGNDMIPHRLMHVTRLQTPHRTTPATSRKRGTGGARGTPRPPRANAPTDLAIWLPCGSLWNPRTTAPRCPRNEGVRHTPAGGGGGQKPLSPSTVSRHHSSRSTHHLLRDSCLIRPVQHNNKRLTISPSLL